MQVSQLLEELLAFQEGLCFKEFSYLLVKLTEMKIVRIYHRHPLPTF